MGALRSDDRPQAITIHAVSELLGIPAPTIRSWERRYGLTRSIRTVGGHRRYLPEHIANLRFMRDEISRGRRPVEAAAILRNSIDITDPHRPFVQAFVDVTDTGDGASVNALLDHCRDRLGVDETICGVILPGMRQIGVSWRLGRCGVDQEKLVTQATQEWLKKVLCQGPVAWHPQTIVLSCGPLDLHTLGLEAVEVLLAQRGWTSHLLGERTQPDVLTAAIRRTEAAATIVVSHVATGRRTAIAAMRTVDRHATQLFYAGNAFLTPQSRRGVPGTYLGEDLIEAVEIVGSSIEKRFASLPRVLSPSVSRYTTARVAAEAQR